MVAHSILAGDQIDTTFDRESDFVFLPYVLDDVIEEIKVLTMKMMDKGANFQVIAPMYDGDLGVNNLNRSLREVLNTRFTGGRATKLKHGACDLYEGDRVMIVKNDYDRMVFNGDVGKVQKISIRDDEVEVKVFDWFDQDSSVPRYVDKVFTFKVEEARHILRVAYACTVHKVQGQEFDYVLTPMTMKYGIMLYRNLLYTAITRAKKKVFILGDSKAFSYAVGNDRETVRNSALSELISKQSADYASPPDSHVPGPEETDHVEETTSSKAS
jgi:exodeoxyribonuclease V alpha subunit